MTTTVLVTLAVETCCDCGVVFGIEANHQHHLRATGAWFFCPNGHRQHYTETEAQKLRKQLEREQRRRENVEAYARSVQDQNDAERKAHAVTKGKLTKVRKRIAAGACPCCRRSFQDLRRHMAGQHPDYAQGD